MDKETERVIGIAEGLATINVTDPLWLPTCKSNSGDRLCVLESTRQQYHTDCTGTIYHHALSTFAQCAYTSASLFSSPLTSSTRGPTVLLYKTYRKRSAATDAGSQGTPRGGFLTPKSCGMPHRASIATPSRANCPSCAMEKKPKGRHSV